MAQGVLTRERATTVAQAFDGKRIVVLGDLMLDEFIWGRVRRISPEAPVPVVEVESHSIALGGAGNVVSNLKALGATAIPVGAIGDDMDAERLRASLRSLGITTDGLISDTARPTTLKTRIIAHSQQVVRADRESRKSISPEVEERIANTFREHLQHADAVVVSDYNKGLLTSGLLKRALGDARARDLIVCLDPKTRSFANYNPVTIITPNNQEAGDATGIEIVDDETLSAAGRSILTSLACRAVLITRGEEGMTLFTGRGEVTHIPTVAQEVYDVTGAGDTVIATLALALAAGANDVEAAVLANHAAGVVVGKVGTATVTREELLATT
ncbi:MAG TPA: D-glycero-beta-D-manno-heptose-7-phosphate kinase [Blastocatellia bacterium]|nr:D-glycero-beta-D-manno-heptose-7-phosphate kinase [Blastocatellia bacterium]